MGAGYRDSLSAPGAFTVVMALHASERPHP
jgi:hypothetical protein